MLLNQTHLSFGEIADRWARENASHPAALERDKILERVEAGLRSDEFDYAELTIRRTVKRGIDGRGNYVSQPEGWRPATRDILHYTLFHVHDDFNKPFLEELRISKKGFRQWCIGQNFSLPEFWFNAADRDAPSETSDRPSGGSRYKEWADRQKELIEGGQAENYQEASQQIAASEGVDTAYVLRECRRVRNAEREKTGKNNLVSRR